MGRAVAVDAPAWLAVRAVGFGSFLIAAGVSACWWPMMRYPPGSVIRPMLPVMATAIALVLSGRLAWEAVSLCRVTLASRVAIALMPMMAALFAVAWPLVLRAVLGLDMSG